MVRWLQQLRTPLTNSLPNNITPQPSTRTIFPTTRRKDSELSSSIYHLGTCKVASTSQPQRCKTFPTARGNVAKERKGAVIYNERGFEFIKNFFNVARKENCTMFPGRSGTGWGRRQYCTHSTEVKEKEPKKVSLHDYHVENGGKMVPFAGYLLPVSYGSDSITASHVHTRTYCSVFDVSHMMQTEIRGKDRVEFLESLTTADIQKLEYDQSALAVFTDPVTGGILDDIVVTKTLLGHLYVVSNAGRREHDRNLLMEAAQKFKSEGKDIRLLFYEPEDLALIAVQGPRAVTALQKLIRSDISGIGFMRSICTPVAGIELCRVTRCGYTGEDGFEISLHAMYAKKIFEFLLDEPNVKLAGLGARDSLRLEAGLCLYGHDIDHTTTPVEAGLSWLVAKRRRETKDFPGAKIIMKQLREGAGKKRVGFRASAGPPVRSDARVFSNENGSEEVMGYVTSGGPSPTLGVNIAMGYVPTEKSKPGTTFYTRVRNKIVNLTVCKMPFVPTRYFPHREEWTDKHSKKK